MSIWPYVSMNTLTCERTVIYSTASHTHLITSQSIAKAMLMYTFDVNIFAAEPHLS